MKRSTGIRMIVLMAAFFTAVSTYAQQSARELQTQIEDINKELVKYMLEGNTEKGLAYYTDDAISLPSYEPMLQGIDQIRKAAQENAKSGMKVNSYEPTTVKVIPEGNMITEIGTYKINITLPGMSQPVDDHGKYLTIWEKQSDGSLKIKIETWNSDVNPMNMMTP
jgi:ketosteroid isomerase-like protein